MYPYGGILQALWLAFLATSIIASPVQNLYPRGGANHDENIPLDSGIIRFGFEFETILQLKPMNPKTHQTLENIIKKGQDEYRELKTNHPLGKSFWFSSSGAYHSTFTAVRQFLVDEWSRYSGPTQEVLDRNKWLKAANDAMKINPELNKHSFKKHPIVDRYRTRGTYPKDAPQSIITWSITKDDSLYMDDSKSLMEDDDVTVKLWQFPIEFISPILPFGASDYWYMRARYPIELFMSFLLDHCGFEIVSKPMMTSSHVHVSPRFEEADQAKPLPERFRNLKRTKRMVWSALFFETTFRAMLPEERLMTPWANEWHHPSWIGHILDPEDTSPGKNFKGELDSKEKVLSFISSYLDKSITDNHQIINLMNPYIFRRNGGIPASNRYWGWNFNNLLPGEGSKGTIECRRGGQSLNADDAMFNIELVAAFALAACANGDHKTLQEHFDFKIGSLKQFIYYNMPKPIPSLSISNQYLKEMPGFLYGYQPAFKFPELEKRFASLGLEHDPATERVEFPDDLEIDSAEKVGKGGELKESSADTIESEQVHIAEVENEWKVIAAPNLEKTTPEKATSEKATPEKATSEKATSEKAIRIQEIFQSLHA